MIKRKRIDFLVFVACGIVGVAYLYLTNPEKGGIYPPCVFHTLTQIFMAHGLYCPGCGATRCVHSLLHGNLVQALAYNALLILSLPYLAACGCDYVYHELRGRTLRKWLMPVWAIWLWLAVSLAFCILRNLPISPFNALAPHLL
ncbi:MAG: DUF2752 domain-containing protein [Candidatus Sumerlaeota bacterium]|nr:DUF2752 domain-containing protein [Candidatus Sumerlaeota bacterium]